MTLFADIYMRHSAFMIWSYTIYKLNIFAIILSIYVQEYSSINYCKPDGNHISIHKHRVYAN